MSQKQKWALVIFAREPVTGEVKTRMLTTFSKAQVTRLYKAFVRDVLQTAKAVGCQQKFIYVAGKNSRRSFLTQFQRYFILKEQKGGDLGERMHQAFVDCSHSHFTATIIIGTDCLSLTERDIRLAFEKLAQYDCVIGPADDGGYYLLGLRRPTAKLFKNMPWGSRLVFKETLKRVEELKKSVYILEKRGDLDTAEDLNKWFKSPKTSFYTQRVLQGFS